MSTSATPNGEGFEVVVDTDGALRVPAEELARHGLRPGAHLRLVHHPQPPAQRRRARGALTGVVTAAALDAFEAALDEAKTERIVALERRWRESCRRLAGPGPVPGRPDTVKRARTRCSAGSRGLRRSDRLGCHPGRPVVRQPEDQFTTGGPGIFEHIRDTLLDPSTNLVLQPISVATMIHFDAVPLNDLRDPFDRFILATAIQLGIPLVSADRAISNTKTAEIVW